MATEKQLKERWKTPEGEKVVNNIKKNICDSNWERFLKNFPYVSEVNNDRDLRYINLSSQHFTEARWKNFNGSKLIGPNLTKTDLTGADLMSADLTFAELRGAKINKATLVAASLMKSNLSGAIIKNSDLMGSNLWGAYMNSTSFKNTSLFGCNLTNSNLSGSSLLNCNIYGISAWNIKTDKNTIMKNLIINEDPLITVDDIEIAQFIYLVLNNEKISKIITSMRTKGVLVLGSFNDDSKPILNRLTEILPRHDLIPMIFYFKPPKEHRFMETVKTMALLSKFVIVDLSKRSGQLYEIANLVKDVKVPYITIAIEGTKVSGMLEDLHDYYWYRKDYFPYPEKEWEKELPELVKNEVIPWADEINNELLKNRDR